jgi:hypothetical protein
MKNTIPTYNASDFDEFENGRLSTEASALGLPPGMWPNAFEVANLGNGRPFLVTYHGDGGADYLQEFGSLRITIFND